MAGQAYHFVGLGISLLHDFMLINQFVGMYSSLIDQCFRFRPGIIENGRFAKVGKFNKKEIENISSYLKKS